MKPMMLSNTRAEGITAVSRILLFTALALFLVSGLINCGGSSSSSQPSKAYIQQFIAKHQTMVDPSLASFYIEKEQSKVARLVDQTISAKEEAGTLATIQQATFDFSNLTIDMMGEKSEYINDEPKTFVKVAVKGSYIMKLQDKSRDIEADDVIILERVGHDWKVTETINPWS